MEEWMIYVLKINLLAAEDRASAAVLQEEERLSAFPETETGSREQETFSVEQEKEVLPAASAEGEKDTVPSMESSGAYREQPAEETAPLRTEAAKTGKIRFSSGTLFYFLGLFWIAGAASLALCRVLACKLLHTRLRRSGVPVRERRMWEIYRSACRELELDHGPALEVSGRAESPLLTGLLHPRLYLPEKPYTDRELRMIFLHELYHYKYKDLWYKMVMLAVRTLYWFNPLLGVMGRKAEADLESICDSRVVGKLKREERILYQRLLVETAVSPGGQMAAGLRDSTDSLKDRILYMTRSRTLKSGMILSVLLMAAVVLSNLLVGCSLEAAPREEREEQQEPPVREPEEPEKENSAGQETQEEPAFPPGTGGGLTAQELEDLLGLPYIGNQLLASSEEIPLPSGGVSGLRYDLDEDGVLEILAGAVEQQGGSSFFSLRVFEWENGGWTEADRREYEDSVSGQFDCSVLFSRGEIILNHQAVEGFDDAYGAPDLDGSWRSAPVPENGYIQERYRYTEGQLRELHPVSRETPEYWSWLSWAEPFCSLRYSYLDTLVTPEESADPIFWEQEYPADQRSFLFRTVDGQDMRALEGEDYRTAVPLYFEEYLFLEESEWLLYGGTEDETVEATLRGRSRFTDSVLFDIFHMPTNPEFDQGLGDGIGAWPGGTGGAHLLWRGEDDIVWVTGGDKVSEIYATTAEGNAEDPLELLHILYTALLDADLISYTFQYTGAEEGILMPY